MADTSKKISKKEQKIKEENIRKLDEQVRNNKIISKDYKKKINKQLVSNIIICFIMVLYLCTINILYLYIDTQNYFSIIRIASIIIPIISIIFFEYSYKKDNEKIFLYGVEVLVIATITLFLNYIYFMYFDKYNRILTGITIIFVIYYILKILLVRTIMKKNYYKNQNDIKDIVKK